MSNHATPAPSSGHTSRAKDPSIVQEAQKPIGWIRNIFLLILILIAVASSYRTYQEVRKKAEQRAVEIAARPVTQTQSPTLELRYECEIPCTRKIDFRYSFRGDGHDLKVTHPGIKEPVIYKVGAILQEDDPHLKGLEKGMTTYDAVDPALHKCRIQVFEKKGIWP